jgi:ketosteroid isomerase-like protein
VSRRALLSPIDAGLLALLAVAMVAVLVLATGRARTDADSTAVTPIPFTTTTDATTSTTTDATTSTQSTTTSPAVVPIGDADIRALMTRYVDAYDAEDAAGLAALMTDTVVRRTVGGAIQVGPDAVAAEYQRQFDALDGPGYGLQVTGIQRQGAAATVEAAYAISAANTSQATGSIRMHLVRADGHVLIAWMTITPD